MHLFKELAFALEVIRRYLEALGLPQTRALLRLDGLSGTGAVMAELDGFFVMRGKDSTVLDHPSVQARLHLPPDAHFSRPESTLVRTLYDCPDVPVGPEGCPAASSWLATWRPRKRAASVAPARAWSTTSFSPISRKMGSPPPMSWPSTCIVALLNQCLPMKMTNRTRIAGAVMHPLDKKPGKSSFNGSGTYSWNWAIRLSQLRCAPPGLLLPSPLSHRTRLLPRAMLPLRWACPGKRTASLVKTFLSSRMGRGAVPQGRSLLSRSGAGKPMAACVWCMPPAFAVAAPVRCVSSASGMAAPPRNRARSVSCRIRCRWVLLPCSGTPPAAESIDGPACGSCDTSASR
jgi:hypothetical protein